MNQPDFSANIERFTGFADDYDRFRPEPPAALADLLCRLAEVSKPKLGVDLGCGTGLSTRYWADRAEKVIGVEPSDSMRAQAEAATAAVNISWRKAFSQDTGLPKNCAQIVTCGQSLHWMNPAGTFAEAARILQPGGVFAAYDYDWPPVTGNWKADAAYETCMENARRLERAHGLRDNLQQHEKSGHLRRMRESGAFRYVREILLHHTETGDAARLTGLLLSQGHVQSLLKKGVTEEELGIAAFSEEIQRLLGSEPALWHWCCRLRIGVV